MPSDFLTELAGWLLLIWGIGSAGAVVWITLTLAGPEVTDRINRRVWR